MPITVGKVSLFMKHDIIHSNRCLFCFESSSNFLVKVGVSSFVKKFEVKTICLDIFVLFGSTLGENLEAIFVAQVRVEGTSSEKNFLFKLLEPKYYYWQTHLIPKNIKMMDYI